MLLAASLAGCAATPQDYRNDKEQPLPSGQGAFGEGFTWEWRKKDAPPSSAPATTAPATPAQAGAAKPGDAERERQEFEEWRAWQEWKRKNAK